MPKTCVAVFAADYCRSYVPIFLFCLFRAYPDYASVVFLRKPLGTQEKPGMKLVKGNFQLAYNAGAASFPKLKDRAARVRLFQAARFLVFTPQNVRKYLAGYDHIYVTDVDMLIMPEEMPLHEQHLRHCEVLGLPYSNFVRNTEPPRLTGLHFGTREFFEAVAPVVALWRSIPEKGFPKGLGRCPDEAMWYRIVKESGFTIPPKCSLSEQKTWELVYDPARFNEVWFGPHHGVHVGFGRAMGRFRQVFATEHYKRYMASLRKLIKEDGRMTKLIDCLHPRAKAAMRTILKEG